MDILLTGSSCWVWDDHFLATAAAAAGDDIDDVLLSMTHMAVV